MQGKFVSVVETLILHIDAKQWRSVEEHRWFCHSAAYEEVSYCVDGERSTV